MKQEYAQGTYLLSDTDGRFVTGRVMCSDGQVRQLARIAPEAWSYGAVHGWVRVKGKWIKGNVEVETMEGSSVPTPADPAVVKFVRYNEAKHGALLPPGRARFCMNPKHQTPCLQPCTGCAEDCHE